MATDTTISNFIINKLTTSKYNELKQGGQISDTQLYMITDDEIDLSTKEDKSNKVTSLSAQSTDTQYPSAKCVYDYIQTELGSINTALEAIIGGGT